MGPLYPRVMLGQEEASDGGEGSKPAIIAVTTLF